MNGNDSSTTKHTQQVVLSQVCLVLLGFLEEQVLCCAVSLLVFIPISAYIILIPDASAIPLAY